MNKNEHDCFICGKGSKASYGHGSDDGKLIVKNKTWRLKYKVSSAKNPRFFNECLPKLNPQDIGRLRHFVYFENKKNIIPDIEKHLIRNESEGFYSIKADSLIPKIPKIEEKEKLLLKYFVKKTKILGRKIFKEYSHLTEGLPEALAVAFCTDENELNLIVSDLKNLNYLEYNIDNNAEIDWISMRVTTQGFKEVENVNSESLVKKSKAIQIFISHSDKDKVEVKKLGSTVEKKFNVKCFVSHDSIEPMKIWQKEILKSLKEMDIFISYITENFHKSVWANQEVGFAIAKDIPIFLFSADGSDPEGFKSNIQKINKDVDKLLKFIQKELNKKKNI